MAASNSERIDDIVDPKVLQQLSDLNKGLDGTFDEMVKVLAKTTEVEKSLSKIGTSYKDLVDAIAKYEATQRQSNTVQNQSIQTQNQIERLRQRVIESTSNEAREVAALNIELQDNRRIIRNQVQEQNSATGSINQMRAQLNLLRNDWNSMSSQERRTPLGRQTREEIQELETGLRSLRTTSGSTFGSLRNAISVFAGNLMTKAVEGLGQLLSRAKEFVSVGIDVAAKAQGIEAAFSQLNKPGLLDDLRKATRGTLTDLDLMKSAVQGSDFKIPLEDMGTLLKFVQQQATRTGGDFEKLREQIVLGIGRESKQRIDDFGISAIAFRLL